MLQFKASGDLFDERVDALVNTVNCKGVMGRGIALEFKKRFPDNFKDYKHACSQSLVQPGVMHIFDRAPDADAQLTFDGPAELPQPRYIINFPTKRHWRSASRIEDIASGLDDLRQQIERRGIRSLAMPALGSSLGKLDWADVRALIEDKLCDLPDGVEVIIFEPQDAQSDGRPNRSQPARPLDGFEAALIHIIDLRATSNQAVCVTEPEVQQMMYLLQEADKPLELEFTQTFAKPCATRVSQKLRRLSPHYLTFCKGGDEGMQLVPGSASDAAKVVATVANIQLRFQRLTGAIKAVNNLPLLVATIQAANDTDPAAAVKYILAAVQQRDHGEFNFKRTYIERAIKALRQHELLPATVPINSKQRQPVNDQMALGLDLTAA